MGQIFLDFPEERIESFNVCWCFGALIASILACFFGPFWLQMEVFGGDWGHHIEFVETGEAAYGATGIFAKSDEQGRMLQTLARWRLGDW